VNEPDVKMRLQGGPFDGVIMLANFSGGEVEPPDRWWIVKCPPHGGIEWWPQEVRGGELYRLEGEKDGWTLYVYTDERLGGGLETEEREKVPAGGWA
jgi:hypothetical protein